MKPVHVQLGLAVLGVPLVPIASVRQRASASQTPTAAPACSQILFIWKPDAKWPNPISLRPPAQKE